MISQLRTPIARTAFTGTRLRATRRQVDEPGTARSRENANIIRDAEVTEAVPQKNCATTAMSSRNSAQVLPIEVVQM